MALLGGFLRQRCQWTPRGKAPEDFDVYGQSALPATEIKCRWEYKAGWAHGLMGDDCNSNLLSYKNKVYVEAAVDAGDELSLVDKNRKITSGKVIAVETLLAPSGKEEGRICYV